MLNRTHLTFYLFPFLFPCIDYRFKMPSVLHEVTVPFRKATFGMGCFWACDSLFGAQPGVLRTRVGYSGGTTMDPVYKKIQMESQSGQNSNQGNPKNQAKPSTSKEDFRGDHTEVIEIDYDPHIISYEDLLELFWNNHEYGYTTVIKRQYMSLILYHNEDQKRIAEISLKKQSHKTIERKIVTEIAPAGAFYPAEDYHQKYRLQQHTWLCKELGLTPELLQTSHVAARLNGYLVGVGKEEDFEKDVVLLGLNNRVAKYVRVHLIDNMGGSLYC